MLARPTAHRGSMGRPIEPRQRGNLLQEGQIPTRTALRQFGLGLFLGFRLINVGRSQYAREQF